MVVECKQLKKVNERAWGWCKQHKQAITAPRVGRQPSGCLNSSAVARACPIYLANTWRLPRWLACLFISIDRGLLLH